MFGIAFNIAKYIIAAVVYQKVVASRQQPQKTSLPPSSVDRDLKVDADVPVAKRVTRKKAVCIGINYTKTAHELKGCINDARMIKSMLMGQYGFVDADVRVLADAASCVSPTRQNILASIAWLVQGCQPGDVLFFSYSGHGTSIKDANNDEIDGKDEAIFTLDGSIIVDDVLQAELMAKVPKGAKLVCLFDCCHSGTIADLKYCYRYAPENPNKYTLSVEKARELQGGDIHVFSACLDPQTAADSNFNQKIVKTSDGKLTVEWGEGNGAFTWFFLQALKASKFVVTNDEILKQVVTLLKTQKFTQEAQFTCTKAELLTQPFVL